MYNSLTYLGGNMEEKNKTYLAVDTVVLTIINQKLSVLLIQIAEGIYSNKWAVPGGLVNDEESLDDAAMRVLSEKTNLRNVFLEQLYTFGDPKRDSRKRSVSVAYFALIPTPEKIEVAKKEYYKDIKWYPVDDLPDMAFDHKKIIEVAHERLKSKLSYTNIVYSLLPKEFTLTQLQRVYEIILGENLDKRNFRKKIESLGILKDLDKRQDEVSHRPAKLYSFRDRALKFF
jgi:8-oxo-dGTP diphosphatase